MLNATRSQLRHEYRFFFLFFGLVNASWTVLILIAISWWNSKDTKWSRSQHGIIFGFINLLCLLT